MLTYQRDRTLAQGALSEARQYTLNEARPWAASGVARAADDPYTVHRYAEMHLATTAAARATPLAAQGRASFSVYWRASLKAPWARPV